MAWRSATELLLLVPCPLLDRVSRVGEVVIELHQCGARILFLVCASERHAELQQIVWCLCPLRVALVTLGKRDCGLSVVSARVICLAEPVLRAPGQPVVWMLSDKALQGCFGRRIVCLLQQTEGKIILLGGRTGRQHARGSRMEGAPGSCALRLRRKWRWPRRAPGRGQCAGADRGIGRRRH